MEENVIAQIKAFVGLQAELGLRGVDTSFTPTSLVAEHAPQSLADVRELLGECERCALCKGRKKIVFGNGDAHARLMFVGEGPGAEEDRQGEPFVGKAGQLLNRMINAMGLSRERVYIANIVKCRPPENRDPEVDEIEACEPFLRKQIEAIKPEVIVALGRCASQRLSGSQIPISRLRGQWGNYAGIDLMPTFHPAYLLRNPSGKRSVWEDLQQVMRRLGLDAPNRRTRSM